MIIYIKVGFVYSVFGGKSGKILSSYRSGILGSYYDIWFRMIG